MVIWLLRQKFLLAFKLSPTCFSVFVSSSRQFTYSVSAIFLKHILIESNFKLSPLRISWQHTHSKLVGIFLHFSELLYSCVLNLSCWVFASTWSLPSAWLWQVPLAHIGSNFKPKIFFPCYNIIQRNKTDIYFFLFLFSGGIKLFKLIETRSYFSKTSILTNITSLVLIFFPVNQKKKLSVRSIYITNAVEVIAFKHNCVVT